MKWIYVILIVLVVGCTVDQNRCSGDASFLKRYAVNLKDSFPPHNAHYDFFIKLSSNEFCVVNMYFLYDYYKKNDKNANIEATLCNLYSGNYSLYSDLVKELRVRGEGIFEISDSLSDSDINDLIKRYCKPGHRPDYFTVKNIDPCELKMNILYCFFRNHYVVVFDDYSGVYRIGTRE